MVEPVALPAEPRPAERRLPPVPVVIRRTGGWRLARPRRPLGCGPMRRGGYGRVVICGVVTAIAVWAASSRAAARILPTARCCSSKVAPRATCSRAREPRVWSVRTWTRPSAVAAGRLGESTFAGVVNQQILHPNRNAQVDPKTGKPLPLMPAGLVTGSDARDVAAYVAQAASKSGEDTGKLASVGASKAEGHRGSRQRHAGHPGRGRRPRLRVRGRERARRPAQDHVRESRSRRAQHRPRGRRRQRGRAKSSRTAASRDHRDLRARRVHVLLLRPRPPRRWHGRHAHRQVGPGRRRACNG